MPRKKYPFPKDRQTILTRQRNLKMARSSHAYVRGNTLKFYEWLETGKGKAIPDGPAIWIGGDCHVGNLGPIANAKGEIDIQIRDLDQTVIGNPAHDLIRLGLSLASSARGSDLPGVTTARMLEQMVEGYEQAFSDAKKGKHTEFEKPEAVKHALKDALRRKWKQLAEDRIEDTTPTIPLGKRFWPLTKEEKAEIKRIFSTEPARRLVTSLRSRDDDAKVEVLDAAYWMKGCSSLGKLRYAVLLQMGGAKGELCLVDIKEAVTPAAPYAAKAKMPKNNAERVVTGARHLSPYLGQRMIASNFDKKAVFLRELLPQDLQLDIEQLMPDETMRVAYYLAMVVGKAHARQMDEATRKTWKMQLNQRRSKTLDAPSWLWSSVVDLLVSHEQAYLEHCRRYATGTS